MVGSQPGQTRGPRTIQILSHAICCPPWSIVLRRRPHARGWRELLGRVDRLQGGEASISHGTWMGKDSKQRPVGSTWSPAP